MLLDTSRALVEETRQERYWNIKGVSAPIGTLRILHIALRDVLQLRRSGRFRTYECQVGRSTTVAGAVAE